MTTLTIIKDDKFVKVDGEGLFLDAVVLAANVHAVQFDGTSGHIEYNDGTANENITSISTYQSIVDAHISKKAEQDAKEQAEVDAQTAAEATYSWKRLQEYPKIQECVHAILDDDLDALQVLRQAVKDKYPKE